MQNTNEKIIKCMVVDDEPMAREVIKRYINQIPNLQLAGEFKNAIEATIFLQSEIVDMIFLDIRMPQLNGTDFVRSLPNTPKIIFTTAFKEYAHEGFELDVVDYLLKPVRFDRFIRAINKAYPQRYAEAESKLTSALPENKYSTSFIYVRVDRKMIKIILDEILYIESDKDYVKVFTQKNTVATRQTISSIEVMLPENRFMRIHRSYIISLDKIKSFTHETVEIANKELPVGKLYRNGFLKLQGS
jgi:two-component system, LytTR family, response regulator